jgi:hypothetical protein
MISRVKYYAKLIRRGFRRVVKGARYRDLSFQGIPVLFGNAFPKSGTHLLIQVLQGFARLGPAVVSGLPAILTYDGPTGQARPLEAILSDLSNLRPGDVAYGHLHALPEVIQFLCRDGVVAFFIYRDPRDVVVSHVHYVTDVNSQHVHHRYYQRELNSFDERLLVSILGRPRLALQDPSAPFPDIRTRFEPYLGWLNQPEVLPLRFEDFVIDQQGVLERIFDRVLLRGFPTTYKRDDAVEVLAAGIDPRRSPTFRSGKLGQWKEAFTAEHKMVFKEVAGDLLIRLSYESDNEW